MQSAVNLSNLLTLRCAKLFYIEIFSFVSDTNFQRPLQTEVACQNLDDNIHPQDRPVKRVKKGLIKRDESSPTRSPLSPLAQTLQRAPLIGCCSPLGSTSLLSPHEALIRSLLNKPFRVPIAGYSGGGYGRSLGVRRAGGRQPLHDPEAEGALVLHWPRELTEHEKLKTDVSRAEVAVVVDPLLTRWF